MIRRKGSLSWKLSFPRLRRREESKPKEGEAVFDASAQGDEKIVSNIKKIICSFDLLLLPTYK